MTNLFAVNDAIYSANSDEGARFLINQGGTSSGKTYCIMQKLIELALTHPRCVITIAGQDIPNLRVGAMRDIQTILGGNAELREYFTENKSIHTFRAANGSLIEFNSYDSPQDAKNGKRDYLFVNEANGITYEVFWQLAIRTRKQVFVDYNPSARFWVHDKLIGRDDARLIISDHRSNGFLSEAEHAKIEAIEDRELWLVYARGLTGKISGLVFSNWGLVDTMPPLAECKMRCYGLDFGFVNDPTALVEVRLAHGELWVDGLIYEQGMTNVDIAKRIGTFGIGREQIIADSAEMKSIEELRRMGLNVTPAVKGNDSVNMGIDVLKRYRINVMRRAKGLTEELTQYKWIVDRDGNKTNKPIDKFNHAIDALRYVAFLRLGTRGNGKARASIITY